MKLSLVKIHIAVLLFGLAGLFGKWIPFHPVLIVFGRVLFASIALHGILIIRHQKISFSNKKTYWLLALLGSFLAFHWVSFFHSIQLSSIAVGLLTYSSFPMFVAILEPVFFKEKPNTISILSTVLAILGIVIIIPEFNLQNVTFRAVLWGSLSALLFAILSLANRSLVRKHSALKIAFFEDGFATIFLIPFLFFIPFSFSFKLLFQLILLGVLFTALSHTLFIDGLKKVKTQTASIIATLEPLYGILFGIVFFYELPSVKILIGGSIILIAVVISNTFKH
jgi:drug/metabolite transporter (DMT)-like permease